MKGITPVIAVILLLLITVAMVGFAFIWFSRVTTMTTSATQANIENTMTMQAKRVAIENIQKSNTAITVRNIGSQNIGAADLAIYVSGAITPCAGGWVPASITPGQTSTCTLGVSCDPSGKTVKVTAPGNFDESQCP
jgi:flagellin-like protein